MIEAPLALNRFQEIAESCHSEVQRNMLESLLDDLKENNLYLYGGTLTDPGELFIDPERTIYAYLLTQARPRGRSPYFLSLGLCPGPVTFNDWALMGSIAKTFAVGCADYEQTDLNAVRVLGPVRVGLLITLKDHAYEQHFLIPKELTPMQGLASIFRAVVAHEGRLAEQLYRDREKIH